VRLQALDADAHARVGGFLCRSAHALSSPVVPGADPGSFSLIFRAREASGRCRLWAAVFYRSIATQTYAFSIASTVVCETIVCLRFQVAVFRFEFDPTQRGKELVINPHSKKSSLPGRRSCDGLVSGCATTCWESQKPVEFLAAFDWLIGAECRKPQQTHS
jgi:hypothetical protein